MIDERYFFPTRDGGFAHVRMEDLSRTQLRSVKRFEYVDAASRDSPFWVHGFMVHGKRTLPPSEFWDKQFAALGVEAALRKHLPRAALHPLGDDWAVVTVYGHFWSGVIRHSTAIVLVTSALVVGTVLI